MAALDLGDRRQRFFRLRLFGAHGQGKTVDVHVLFGDAVFFGARDDLFRDGDALRARFRDPFFVYGDVYKRQAYN